MQGPLNTPVCLLFVTLALEVLVLRCLVKGLFRYARYADSLRSRKYFPPAEGVQLGWGRALGLQSFSLGRLWVFSHGLPGPRVAGETFFFFM